MKYLWTPLGPLPMSNKYDLKWIRIESIDFDNIKKSMLVKKTKTTPRELPIYTSGPFKNCIGAGGLVLMKKEKTMKARRRKLLEEQAREARYKNIIYYMSLIIILAVTIWINL